MNEFCSDVPRDGDDDCSSSTTAVAVKPSASVVDRAVRVSPRQVKGDFFFSLLDIEDGVFHSRELLLRLLATTPDGDVVRARGTTTRLRAYIFACRQPSENLPQGIT